MKLLNERHDYGIQLVLLSVDEGITGYRDDSLEVCQHHLYMELTTTKRSEGPKIFLQLKWSFSR